MKKTLYNFVFDSVVNVSVVFAIVITLYPFLYVLSASISDPVAVLQNKVTFFPKGFSIQGYLVALKYDQLWLSYYNTVYYTVIGTFLNVIVTLLAAYPLSRRSFFARNFFMVIIVITMFFSGGLIPAYVLITRIGLYNTRWVMMIPGLISTWNLIVCRTYLQSLPGELFEAARTEGCSELKMLWKIVIPLARPIIAVMALFYGIAHWNSFFNALLFLADPKLQPLQITLRKLVIQSSMSEIESIANSTIGFNVISSVQLKYVVIMLSSIPIIMLYPFVQKYFVKGIMIGALKG